MLGLLRIVFLIALFGPISSYAQLNFSGTVKDANTLQPLPYVNIGIVNKGMGTVSNEEGVFSFTIDTDVIDANDIIQFSSMGYRSVALPLTHPESMVTLKKEVFMEPKALALDEVVVSNYDKNKVKKSKLGHFFKSKEVVGYWKNEMALGGELGTKIDANRKLRKLNTLSFTVLENQSDSLLIRINIYDGSSDVPERKINRETILFTLKKNTSEVKIDLDPYRIYLRDDFIVSLELLKAFGGKIGLVLAGSDDLGYAYQRNTSQDNWTVLRGKTLQFYLDTSEVIANSNSNLRKPRETTKIKIENQSVPRIVNGIVFDSGSPIENVEIRVLGKNLFTRTDVNGRYQIEADTGAIINFSYFGMNDVVKTVTKNTFAVNVSMQKKIQELDEVIVSENRTTDNDKPKSFTGSFGEQQLQKAGYAVTRVTGDALNLAATDTPGIPAIANALKGKVANYKTGPDGVILRSKGSLNLNNTALWDVDGMTYEGYPPAVDLNAIEDIYIVRGLAGTNQYGSRGAGGVIVVKTRINSIDRKTEDNETYKDDILEQQKVNKNLPTYYRDLLTSKTFEEAKATYERYLDSYRYSANYIMDSYKYFCSIWKKPDYADGIFKKHISLFKENPSLLKAMAYHMEAFGQFHQAIELYETLLEFNPNQLQSYLDLARSYRSIGRYKKAAEIFVRCNYLLDKEFLPSGKEEIFIVMAREFENLLQQKGKQMVEDHIQEYQMGATESDFRGTRILFEWNDPDAQFELQFVDASKNHFVWQHSDLASSDRIYSEKRKGYFCEEFLIDRSDEGNWQINAKYLGKKRYAPIFLKVTTYTDYGGPGQTEKITVHRLFLRNVNQQIVDIDM